MGNAAAAEKTERQRPLVEAQAAFNSAHANVLAAEERLDAQLSELAPGLTDVQHQQYIEKFRSDNQPIYAAEDAAASQLKQALSSPDLDQVARDYPDLLPNIQQAVSSLAQTSQARAALDWLNSKFGPGAGYEAGNPYQTNAFAFHDETIASIVETAIASSAGAIAGSADVGGEASKLLASLQDLANAGIGGSVARDEVHLLAGSVPLSPGSGAHAVAAIEDAYHSGGTPKLVAAAYVITGALVAAGLVEGVGDTPADRVKFLGDLAITIQGGAEFTSAMLSDASSILKHGVLASEGFIAGLKRAVPIAGAIGAALYALSGLVNGSDKSVLGWTKVAADAATAVLLFVAPSAILPLIGIGISALCSLLIGRAEDGARHDEEAARLIQIGVDPAAARVMADHPSELVQLAAVPGLGAEEIQRLAATHPGLFESPDNVAVFAAVVGETGLSGDDIVGFADALASGPDGESSFGTLAIRTANSSEVRVVGPDRYAGPTALLGVRSLGGSAAIDFLEQHAPGAMDRAETREAADSRLLSDWDALLSGTGLATLFQAVDDPVYRSRLIEDLVHAGGDTPANLLLIAERVVGDPQAASVLAQAVGDAFEAGVLSSADANAVLLVLGAPQVHRASAGSRIYAV